MSKRALVWNLAWVALALATSVATLATRDDLTSGEKLARARHLIEAFRAEAVDALSIERGGERFVVRRAEQQPVGASQARWQWVEPFQGEAEEAAVDQLLRAVEFATWLRQVAPADVDRAAFGLDSPTAVVQLEMAQVRYRLRLGSAAPSPPGAHYVEVSGEGAPNKGVYVVSESTARDLNPDPEDLRVRQIIPYSGSALREIRVELAGRQTTWVRLDRNTFRFAGAFDAARVDRAALAQVLLAFARTTAERFLPIERALQLQSEAVAAGQPLLNLELTPRDGDTKSAKVTLGGACPDDPRWVLAVRSQPRPSAGCIARSPLPELFSNPEALIDRALFQAELSEVESLAIERGLVGGAPGAQTTRLELVRRGDGFEMRAPGTGPTVKEATVQRLQEILQLRGRVGSGGAALDFSAPTLRVTLAKASSEPEGETERVELVEVKQADGAFRVFARRGSDGAILELGPSAQAAFNVDALLLRPLSLLSLPARGVKSVRVRREQTSWQVTQDSAAAFELETGAGSASGPAESGPHADAPHDAALCVQLVETVGSLEALRWVSEQSDPEFGLREQEMVVEIEDFEGHSWAVTVGARTVGGRYAAIDSQAGVFVLAAEDVETLGAPPLDRSGFAFDPKEADSLELSAAGTHVALSRLGNDWVPASSSPELRADEAVQLALAVSKVRALGVLGLNAKPSHELSQPVLRVRFETKANLLGGAASPGPARNTVRQYEVGASVSFGKTFAFAAREVETPGVFALDAVAVREVLELLRAP